MEDGPLSLLSPTNLLVTVRVGVRVDWPYVVVNCPCPLVGGQSEFG